MKKSLIFALALAVPAMAGDEKSAPVTVVDVPVPVPAIVATPTYGIELGGNYTYMYEGLEVDTYGFDITGIYNINSNWAVTLRFSWATGTDTYISGYDHSDLEITNWSIAPGIRYTAPLCSKVSWFAGANVGYGKTEGTNDWTDTYTDEWVQMESESYSASASGVTYTIEAGLRYDCTESCYLYGAVQLWGTTAAPDDTDEQMGVSFRAGVGYSF